MSRKAILFVVENDFYPHDMRVYNECTTLSKRYRCHVLAPRAPGQKLFEVIGAARCLRFPIYHAGSVRWIFIEYLIAWLWMALLVPVISLIGRVGVIHVANPPDFIIPTIAWLRLFGVKIVYDMHDVSSETLRAKIDPDSRLGVLIPVLDRLESASIRMADLTIATNESILARVRSKIGDKVRVQVVRNSNRTVYRCVDDIGKEPCADVTTIGYFGVLADDSAAGLENIVQLAASMIERGVHCRFSIVGNGPGLPSLQHMVTAAGLDRHFVFHGFVPMPQAYDLIKEFDFGLVSWGDLPKNHLHTAMKIMDYMCCAVPVCSLQLTEQMRSTGGVGIHGACFPEIAERIAHLRETPTAYEELRRSTLLRFNDVLCWELQERELFAAYGHLMEPA